MGFTRKNAGRCPRAVRELLIHAGWRTSGSGWVHDRFRDGAYFWDGALLASFSPEMRNNVKQQRCIDKASV